MSEITRLDEGAYCEQCSTHAYPVHSVRSADGIRTLLCTSCLDRHPDLATPVRNHGALRDAVREYFDLLDHGDEQRFVEARKRLRELVK